jgi:hypothetical protein
MFILTAQVPILAWPSHLMRHNEQKWKLALDAQCHEGQFINRYFQLDRRERINSHSVTHLLEEHSQDTNTVSSGQHDQRLAQAYQILERLLLGLLAKNFPSRLERVGLT